MTLQFNAPYRIDPNYNPEQEGLDRIGQSLKNISGTTDRWSQESRQSRMQELQMQLLKQEQDRKRSEDQRKMMETQGEWGTPAPLDMTTPMSGPMTQGQGMRSALDPTSPASQGGGMIERFRSWQQQRRGGGGPVQPEMGMPQPSVGYNEVMPSVPGYTPEQIRSVGGSGRMTLGSKQSEQLTKLFPKDKPVDDLYSPVPGVLSKNGRPLVINKRTGQIEESSVDAKLNTTTTLDAKNDQNKSKLDTTFELYETAKKGLEDALGNTATGPIVGRMPAFTSDQQTAQGAVAAMAPVLKQLFRVAGEGVFTDRDQALLLDMVAKRTERPEARQAIIANMDNIVRAKLGKAKGGVQGGGGQMKVINGVRYEKRGGQWYLAQ